MTQRHRTVLAALSWLAIVAVGSTLVWTVVAHAGRGVGKPAEDTSAESVAAPTGPTSPGIGSSPSTPDPGEGGSGDGPGAGSPSPVDGASSSTPSSSAPSTSPTATQDATATQDPTDEGSSGSGPPAVETHRKAWQGAAGRVVASCSGSRISLVSAVPNNGWHIEVDGNGPEELSVHFELLEDEEGDRVSARGAPEEEIHARCVSGTPSFSVNG